MIFIIAVVNFILAGFLVFLILVMPINKYRNACTAMENGNYMEAFELFTKGATFKAGRQKAYICCQNLALNEQYVDSFNCYMKIKNYEDSMQKAHEVAEKMFEENMMKESWKAFKQLQDSESQDASLLGWQSQILETQIYDEDFNQVKNVNNGNYVDIISMYIDNIYDYRGITDLNMCDILLQQCSSLSDEVEDKEYLTNKINGIIDTDAQIKEIMSSMTLEEKVGQMLIVAMKKDINSMVSLIDKIKPGGVLFFGDDITTYEATLAKVKKIKLASDIPLIIGVDQEGGGVQRINNTNYLTTYSVPAMKYVGDKNSTTLAYETGRILAEQLRVFGMNMDFAPVADINSNPNNPVIGRRAFSSNADTVSKMSVAVANGLTDNNVIAVYKHFPGHGDTSSDSHYSLPVVNKSLSELYQTELKPFINAIQNNAEVIMVGHIALPQLTSS